MDNSWCLLKQFEQRKDEKMVFLSCFLALGLKIFSAPTLSLSLSFLFPCFLTPREGARTNQHRSWSRCCWYCSSRRRRRGRRRRRRRKVHKCAPRGFPNFDSPLIVWRRPHLLLLLLLLMKLLICIAYLSPPSPPSTVDLHYYSQLQ